MKSLLRNVVSCMLLVLALTAVAACGTGGGGGGTTAPPAGGDGAAAATDDGAAAEPADLGDLEAAPVPVRFLKPGTELSDAATGFDAINAQLRADGLNIEASTIRVPWDVYLERLNLMLATGEEFELLHIMQDIRNLSSFAGIGAIESLEPYIGDFPNLINRFEENDWLGTMWAGERFAVPATWRSFENVMAEINVRTDVMRAVGFDEFPANDLDALIELMLRSQEFILEETGIMPYHWMHQLMDNAHWLHRMHPNFPFQVEQSLGIVLARQDGTIESFYESDEFRFNANFYRRLFQEGLIHPDVLSLDPQFKWDMAGFGAVIPSQTFHPAVQLEIERNTDIVGATVEQLRMAPHHPDVFHLLIQNLNAVSSTASDRRAALAFLDWVYASPANHDLYHYGIEGVHWHDRGPNLAYFARDEQDAFMFREDYWMTAFMDYFRFEYGTPQSHIDVFTYRSPNYIVSPIAGFIFDRSDVLTELTNLQVEIIASIYPIKFGMVDYDTHIDAAISNLRAAGLDAYLDEYRRQFDAWVAANPDVRNWPGVTIP